MTPEEREEWLLGTITAWNTYVGQQLGLAFEGRRNDLYYLRRELQSAKEAIDPKTPESK